MLQANCPVDPPAQVGLQFNVGGNPFSWRGLINWVDHPGPTGSYPAITIVAP